MKKVLYITANPQSDERSYSKRTGKYYLEQLKLKHEVEVIELDVYKTTIPLIDEDVLSAWGMLRGGSAFNDLSDAQQQKVGQMGNLLNQFKEADEYVVVTPVWNFSLPPMLKAYIDTFMIAGETFKYSEAGPVGLMTDKKATIIQAAGSFMSDDAMVELNFANKYLEKVFQFIGITEIKHITIEGLAIPGLSDEDRFLAVHSQVDAVFV